MDRQGRLWGLHAIGFSTFVRDTPSPQYTGSSWYQDVRMAYDHSHILLPYHTRLVASKIRVLSKGERYRVSSNMVDSQGQSMCIFLWPNKRYCLSYLTRRTLRYL
ncbi:hypothetical protein K492DRAFT_173819 [Lichtheimia hyalospora FSU 10163]|nr:hypothetical protein K492DRAFT_173819 [Lichtheimia hyalospora FSU 10163]